MNQASVKETKYMHTKGINSKYILEAIFMCTIVCWPMFVMYMHITEASDHEYNKCSQDNNVLNSTQQSSLH